MEKEENLGPIPFRYNPTWIQEIGAMYLIHQAWFTPMKSALEFVQESKLRAVKKSLRKWLKEKYKSLGKERRDLICQLEKHHKVM